MQSRAYLLAPRSVAGRKQTARPFDGYFKGEAKLVQESKTGTSAPAREGIFIERVTQLKGKLYMNFGLYLSMI